MLTSAEASESALSHGHRRGQVGDACGMIGALHADDVIVVGPVESVMRAAK